MELRGFRRANKAAERLIQQTLLYLTGRVL